MKILITGVAGFIGSKLAYELTQRGNEVVGIDNINDYYDTRLKEARLRHFGNGWRFIRMDIADHKAIDKLFEHERFDKVMNLAAQAGVRYSITNPYAYMQSNLLGFLNILESCRHHGVKYFEQCIRYEYQDTFFRGRYSDKPRKSLCSQQKE